MNSENYYIILGINPNIGGLIDIENAIKAKTAEWSRDRNNPGKSNEAKSKLSLVTKMTSALRDENAANIWKTQAEEAKTILAQRQKQRFEELDNSLKLLLVGGKNFLWKKEVAFLIKAYGFTEEEIKIRVKVPIREDVQESMETTGPLIEASIMRGIETELNVVKKKDLYEFLALSSTSSVETLLQKTKEKDKELKSKSDRGGEATAASMLVGYCVKIFETEDKRKIYDLSLQKLRLEKINKLIDLAGQDEKISQEEFEMLVTSGTREGIDKDAVAGYVRQYVKKKHWELETSRESKISEMLGCGFCGTLNQPAAISCVSCGLGMSIKCPSCDHENSNTVRACAKCAFKVGDMPNALPLIRDAREVLAGGDWGAAETLLNRAELFWKGHADIMIVRRQINTVREQTNAKSAILQDLIQKKFYYEAQSEFTRLPPHFMADVRLKSLSDRTQRAVQEAEKMLVEASTAKTNQEKESLFLKILNICADCREAESGLAKIPPENVQGLVSRVEGRLVLLKWAGINSAEPVSYKIIRKINVSPTHYNDGEVLGEVTQTEFQDTSGDTGLTYYYGIFTKRRGIFSAAGTFSLPLIKTANVERLEAIPGNGRIALRWNAPANINRIEVWFLSNSRPSRRNEGHLLHAVKLTGVNHENLINDTPYEYLVIAVFKDIFGKEYFSSGVQIGVAPSAPPEAITLLNINKNNGTIDLSWRDTGVGKTDIYYAQTPHPYKVGEAIPIEDLNKCGRTIPINQPGKASFRPQSHGIYYFLPITSKGGLCVAGDTGYAAHLEDVSNLKGMYSDGILRLEWVFPIGAKKVRISYNDVLLDVSEADYNKDRAYFIQLHDTSLWDLSLNIRTLLDSTDGTLLSNGVTTRIKIRKTMIQFSVHKKASPWFSKSLKFEFRMTANGVVPCPLLLVVKEHNKLISYKDMDRTILVEINPSNNFNNYGGEIEYSPSGKNVKTIFFSLLPQDPNLKDELQIEDNGKKIII